MDVVFEALGAPRRRELLRQMWDQERGAGELRAAHPDVTFGAISQHLRLLERAGLVDARKQGRRRFYKARKDALGPLRAWLEASWDAALQRLRLAAELEERPIRPAGRRRHSAPHDGTRARRASSRGIPAPIRTEPAAKRRSRRARR